VPSCIFLVPSCHQSQHLLRGGLMSHRLSVRLKFRKSSNFLTVCHLSKTERKYRLFRTLRQSFKLIVLVFRRNRGQSGTRRKNTVCAVKIGRLCLQHKHKIPATKKTKIPCYQKTTSVADADITAVKCKLHLVTVYCEFMPQFV